MKQFATYEEENIHYWTNRASGYSTVNQEELASDQKTVWRGVISGRIAARFPDRCPEEIRVLDVGTGPGFFAIILAELGYQVTAVDYTASMLEEARHNAGALAKHIHFQQMNAEKLAFQTASFDVLVTRNVTWNLHDPEKAYAQWMRVLKPGGVLLNFDANWYSYLFDEEKKEEPPKEFINPPVPQQAQEEPEQKPQAEAPKKPEVAPVQPEKKVEEKPERPEKKPPVRKAIGTQAFCT